jgi:hypothetical protein
VRRRKAESHGQTLRIIVYARFQRRFSPARASANLRLLASGGARQRVRLCGPRDGKIVYTAKKRELASEESA